MFLSIYVSQYDKIVRSKLNDDLALLNRKAATGCRRMARRRIGESSRRCEREHHGFSGRILSNLNTPTPLPIPKQVCDLETRYIRGQATRNIPAQYRMVKNF